MRCPTCGRDSLRSTVSLYLDIPGRLMHRLNKEALRDKDVHIQGAGWPSAFTYCTRKGCEYQHHGGA